MRHLQYFCLFYYAIDLREAREVRERKKRNKKTLTKRNWDLGRAVWLLAWLGLLLALWLINPGNATAMAIFGAIAAVRLYEIAVTGFGTALGEESQVRARSLVTIAFYALQLTLIFAILYHSFATADFAPAGSSTGATLPSSDYLYISWAAITSLGSTFTPTTETARFLEVATTSAGIFLLAVLLAFGINEVKKAQDPEPDPEQKKREELEKMAGAAAE